MELTRRQFALTLAALVATSCGSSSLTVEFGDDEESETPPVPQLGLRDVSSGEPAVAGAAITATAYRLFDASRSADSENLTISPMSIALAFAMLELGASGPAVEQLRSLLEIDDPTEFHAAMGAMEVALETERDGVTFRLANAAYLQRGYPFEQEYLDALGANYGPVLREVDFADSGPVTAEINEWVAEQTEDFITDLIPDGMLGGLTRLVLVNALYLLATWETSFDPELTDAWDFVRSDGSTVEVEMMRGSHEGAQRVGDGVLGVKRYDGGLMVQFLLPDEGRFDDVATNLESAFRAGNGQGWLEGDLLLPRFITRSDVDLSPVVKALGVTAPFDGNLLGIAADPDLHVSDVVHQTYVSFDEEGTEAAAATAIVTRTTSAGGPEPEHLILDRPFFYRIFDVETDATIFIGQIADPTAG